MILISSIYFSIKLKFPQLKIKLILKSISIKQNKKTISPTDTLIMSLSSKIGVGSLSGMALCIYYGGIGTIFWIFILTPFLSIITYIENVLSTLYKEPKSKRSGPQYYINNKSLGKVYSLILLISYIFLFVSIQNNTITTLTQNVYSINKTVVSLTVTILASLVLIKGIKEISNICNKIFPIMMLIFILIGVVTLIKNFSMLPYIIISIIKSGLNIKSINGGIISTIIIAFQRMVFANETGVGTNSIISGAAQDKNYKIQGNLGILQTYFINFIVLGITSLIIITSQYHETITTNGIELTRVAFNYHFGVFGDDILILLVILFSFSTIITVYYYGECSLEFLTNKQIYKKILKIITIVMIFLGGIIKATFIWNLIDIFIAILTIINMYSIFIIKETIISKVNKK